MKFKFFLFFIIASFAPLFSNSSLVTLQKENKAWTNMYSLSQQDIDQHFAQVQAHVLDRWESLAQNVDFPYYSYNKSEDEIVQEFYDFNDLRLAFWLKDPQAFPCQSNPEFKVAQVILGNKQYRQPNCISFEHALTEGSYNSSSIPVGKRRFFALEGPLQEHVPAFFKLLNNWSVSHLVCLTDETDQKGTPKCFPYWKDRIVEKEGQTLLSVWVDGQYEHTKEQWGSIEIPYERWQDWEDHHGIDPQQLVEAANRVRKNKDSRDIIAVHCSAGVGRTGTFISSICILDEIDRQLANGASTNEIQLQISKLFLYLNFHRPWIVAKPAQYLTLYRVVDWYLDQYKNEAISINL